MDSPCQSRISGGALLRQAPRLDLFRYLCQGAAAASVGLLIWITCQILYSAWPAIRQFGVGLLFQMDWNPNGDRYGMVPFFVGTGVSSFLALLLAFPLGVFIAIFLSEDFLVPSVRQVIRFFVELLAAIPSVVYGLWGIAEVLPFIQYSGASISKTMGWIPFLAGPSYGNSLLTASLVLALMILPTITAISRSALESVPFSLREGSYSLGATRWETILRILLPSAAPGIVASGVLALGRAMGETMAVAMLIGNSSRLSWSIFSPSSTLASLLANQFAEAQGMEVSVLMYAAAVLMLLTLLVNILGAWVLRLAQRNLKGVV